FRLQRCGVFDSWKRWCALRQFAKTFERCVAGAARATCGVAFSDHIVRDYRMLQHRANQFLHARGAESANRTTGKLQIHLPKYAAEQSQYLIPRKIDEAGPGGPSAGHDATPFSIRHSSLLYVRRDQHLHLQTEGVSLESKSTAAPAGSKATDDESSLVPTSASDQEKEPVLDANTVMRSSLASAARLRIGGASFPGSSIAAMTGVGNIRPSGHNVNGDVNFSQSASSSSRHQDIGAAPSQADDAKESVEGEPLDIRDLVETNLVNFRPRVLAEYVEQWKEWALARQNVSAARQFCRQRRLRNALCTWHEGLATTRLYRVADTQVLRKTFVAFMDGVEVKRALRLKQEVLAKLLAMRRWHCRTRGNARGRALAFRARRFRQRSLLRAFFTRAWRLGYHIPRTHILETVFPARIRVVSMRLCRKMLTLWREEAVVRAPAVRRLWQARVLTRWR
ncbi:unnamed protein product, partial [Amoebophrya sp. A25]